MNIISFFIFAAIGITAAWSLWQIDAHAIVSKKVDPASLIAVYILGGIYTSANALYLYVV